MAGSQEHTHEELRHYSDGDSIAVIRCDKPECAPQTAALRAEPDRRFITHGTVMDTRHHKGWGHGLTPGTTRDINCQSCAREDDPPEYTSGAEDEGAYEAELYAEAADGYYRDGGP